MLRHSLPRSLPAPRSSRPLRALALALALTACFALPDPARAAPASAPTDPDEAFYVHAAECAAALEIDQLALAARAREGETGLREPLLALTEYGFALVGTAYKRGLRNPRADQLLNAARATQKTWDEERHKALAAPCFTEAKALFEDATGIERWLVGRKANSRVDQLLKPRPQG